MKIVVIGLGSMGKRRIRLIKENFNECEIVGIDNLEKRRKEAEEIFKIITYDNLEKINNLNIDVAFVCTSPLSHSSIILELLKNNINVFSEINLSNDKYKEIIELSKEKELNCFLSSTMLYRKEIEYIEKKVKDKKEKVRYRYHVGQYLPDWHPWENYKEFFVGDKKTNGCRELLAIELPWIVKTFGKIKKIFVTKDKISDLNIDYPDNYLIILEHENGNKGCLNIDIVSREAIRDFEVYSNNMHIFWKGTPDSLEDYDIILKERKKIEVYSNIEKDKKYAKNIIENAYLDEIKEFFSSLKKIGKSYKYTYEEDAHIISIIDEIEKE